MSDCSSTTGDVATVRALVFKDLAPVPVFAEAIDKSERTVFRMIAQRKLRSVKIGNSVFVVISSARETPAADREAA